VYPVSLPRVPAVTLVDGLEVVNRDLAEEGDIDRVVRVVVAQDDVSDVAWSYAQLFERAQDRCPGRHHPRVDDNDPVTVADKAHGARDVVGCVAGEEHVELGGARQTLQVVSGHAKTVRRIAQVTGKRFGRLQEISFPEGLPRM